MAELNRFETLAERRLREANERGEFDDLPGSGRPIDGLSRPYDPAWWAKSWASRERVAEAVRQELLDLDGALARIWPIRSHTEVRRQIRTINQRLSELGAEPFDQDEIVGLWRQFGIYKRT